MRFLFDPSTGCYVTRYRIIGTDTVVYSAYEETTINVGNYHERSPGHHTVTRDEERDRWLGHVGSRRFESPLRPGPERSAALDEHRRQGRELGLRAIRNVYPDANGRALDASIEAQEPPVRAGDRVRLRELVERFPHFEAPAGATGTVTVADRGGVWVRLDEHLPGAEEWANEIHFETADEAESVLRREGWA